MLKKTIATGCVAAMIISSLSVPVSAVPADDSPVDVTMPGQQEQDSSNSEGNLNSGTAQTATNTSPQAQVTVPQLTQQQRDELAKNAQQRQELQQKIDENKSIINGIQNQKDRLQSDYNDIARQASELQDEIDKLDNQILTLSYEIEYTNQELDDQYEAYCNRVRTFEEYGTSDYWAILFQSTSLTDLLGRIDFVREVMAHDLAELESVEEAMKALDKEETELENLRADRNAAIEALEEMMPELKEEIQAQNAEIALYEDENLTYQSEYQTLLQKSMSIAGGTSITTSTGMPHYSGADYQGSKKSSDVYQKYILDSGEYSRNPLGSEIVKYTLQFNGGPYVWGGASPEQGFDCSGLMYYVYGQFGYSIMRVAEDQYHHSGREVAFNELQAGDMIFFHPKNGSVSEISHVGMYICDGIFVHAASRASGIKISSLYSDYYSSVYVGAKRIIE